MTLIQKAGEEKDVTSLRTDIYMAVKELKADIEASKIKTRDEVYPPGSKRNVHRIGKIEAYNHCLEKISNHLGGLS